MKFSVAEIIVILSMLSTVTTSKCWNFWMTDAFVVNPTKCHSSLATSTTLQYRDNDDADDPGAAYFNAEFYQSSTSQTDKSSVDNESASSSLPEVEVVFDPYVPSMYADAVKDEKDDHLEEGSNYEKRPSSSQSSTSQQQQHHEKQFRQPRSIWDTSTVQTIPGGGLQTWIMDIPQVEHVQLLLKNDGSTMNAKTDIWFGPDNSPMQLATYSQNGSTHPFSVIIPTPNTYLLSHTIGVRNCGPTIHHHPLGAVMVADIEHLLYDKAYGRKDDDVIHMDNPTSPGLGSFLYNLMEFGDLQKISGSCTETYDIESHVENIQVLIKTDSHRPCQARIELTQGLDDEIIKQVIELYMEDGQERPFFAVIETPGKYNSIRVVNVGDEQFPITACVAPYMVNADYIPPKPKPPNRRQQQHDEGVDEFVMSSPRPPSSRMVNHGTGILSPDGIGTADRGFFFVK